MFKTTAFAILCCLTGSYAFANDVTGTVRLANGRPAKNAVVWLKGAAHGEPLRGVVIDQRDLTFIPHVTAVTVGTTIRFPNSDTVYHNVFAEFEAKRFDFGMYPRGSSKTKLFDKPGIVALLCSVHSNMSAYIMVVDTPYFAVTDASGRFKIKDVESGSYEANVWHESKQTARVSAKVSDGKNDLDLKTARD